MMSRTQKIVTTSLWAAVVVAMVGMIATRATRSRPQSNSLDDAAAAAESRTAQSAQRTKFEPLYDVPDFTFTDQDGKPRGRAGLLGKVWVADFIFTRCGGPCPVMSRGLSGIQKQLGTTDVKLVSFTVDPEHDTPPVLKAYAARYDADEGRWSFLTGPADQMAAVTRAMNIGVSRPDAGNDAMITHSTYFLLIDRAGKVCHIYHSDDDSLKQLAVDAMELAGEKR